MKLTLLQQKIIGLDKSLDSKNKEIEQWIITNTRPDIAVRKKNLVTVCLCCGNRMVFSGNEKFVRCCDCGRIVELVEENDWLLCNRTQADYCATLEVIEDLQVMRTYEIVQEYSANNSLKSTFVREICRHWITSDGHCEVTSVRRFTEIFLPNFNSMRLRKKSTYIEDEYGNNAYILPDIILIPELKSKLDASCIIGRRNMLSKIRRQLEMCHSLN